jgi:hypothetical protein
MSQLQILLLPLPIMIPLDGHELYDIGNFWTCKDGGMIIGASRRSTESLQLRGGYGNEPCHAAGLGTCQCAIFSGLFLFFSLSSCSAPDTRRVSYYLRFSHVHEGLGNLGEYCWGGG